jgi:hypothetical protein
MYLLTKIFCHCVSTRPKAPKPRKRISPSLIHCAAAEHLSKLTGQTTAVKEQITTSGRGWSTNVSRSMHEVSRPLLTDEAMRMKGARKNAQGMISEAGNMVVEPHAWAHTVAAMVR